MRTSLPSARSSGLESLESLEVLERAESGLRVEASSSRPPASGILIDGERHCLDKEASLVVCEQKRVQILTLAGEPLQLISIEGSRTDLWSIVSAGRFMYVSDRGAGCVHVLAPPRMGAGADAAKSRYMTMTPRRGARAAQAAQISTLMSSAEEQEASSGSPTAQQRTPTNYPTILSSPRELAPVAALGPVPQAAPSRIGGSPLKLALTVASRPEHTTRKNSEATAEANAARRASSEPPAADVSPYEAAETTAAATAPKAVEATSAQAPQAAEAEEGGLGSFFGGLLGFGTNQKRAAPPATPPSTRLQLHGLDKRPADAKPPTVEDEVAAPVSARRAFFEQRAVEEGSPRMSARGSPRSAEDPAIRV